MRQCGEKALFILALAAAAACLGLSILGQNWRWLLTAALALELAGLVQLKISGLFSAAPSSAAPAPASGESRLQNVLFRCKHTGFYLLASGLLGQIVSSWVW